MTRGKSCAYRFSGPGPSRTAETRGTATQKRPRMPTNCGTPVGLRPVFHRREDRIRGHVQLCALALLLIRVIENTTSDTWRNIRHELDRLHLVTLHTPNGQVAQRTALTGGQRSILKRFKLTEPARFYDFTPTD